MDWTILDIDDTEIAPRDIEAMQKWQAEHEETTPVTE
jgi:hypothetical protein